MTISRTECVVVASVLTNGGKPGPCVCTALAFWELFESPEASKLAEAIFKVQTRGQVASLPMVKAHLKPEWRKWIDHPVFREGLPLGLAEVEAKWILPHYHNKRLIALVGDIYSRMMNKPESARGLALDLKLKLEEIL